MDEHGLTRMRHESWLVTCAKDDEMFPSMFFRKFCSGRLCVRVPGEFAGLCRSKSELWCCVTLITGIGID